MRQDGAIGEGMAGLRRGALQHHRPAKAYFAAETLRMGKLVEQAGLKPE